jgi:release factor glutamine methyltransferase
MEGAVNRLDRAPTADALLVEGTAALTVAGVSSARLDAEVLLAAACGVDRTALYARARQPVTPTAQQAYAALLARRRQREPLQYILGRQEFWSLDFIVTPDVLIPRPETELLVELVLAIASADPRTESLDTTPEKTRSTRDERGISPHSNLQPFPPSSRPLLAAYRGAQRRLTLCDLGTGSGCIAVALARELPATEIWAIDQSAAALAVARQNARCNGVESRIRFVAGELFAPVAEARFDVVVCNPPYIASEAGPRTVGSAGRSPLARWSASSSDTLDSCAMSSVAHVPTLDQLQPELAWEPRGALDGGADGLDVIRRVVAAAPGHLVRGGWLLMEIGADQGPAALELARAARFDCVSVRADYAGQARVLLAQCD